VILLIKDKPHYTNYYAENCMCISGCHIIFWGDKTIKFGVNVIQRHSSKRQRYEPSSQKT